MTAFRGEFLQTPPIYSALKRDGVPLYKRARRGEEIELQPRPARVDELYITEWQPPHVILHVECAKGFYVRSLAHDLGISLGVGGMLAGLRRSRVGTFRVEEAVSPDELRTAFDAGEWQRYLFAPDEVLLHWRAAILGAETATRLRNGQRVGLKLAPAPPDALCRAYTLDGDFVGVARVAEAGTLAAEKMFSSS